MNTKDYSSKLAMFKNYTIIKSWLALLFIGLLFLPSLHAESINNQPRGLFSKAITQLKAQVAQNIEIQGLKAPKKLRAAMLSASCGMDVFFINDQSGSVDAVENVQSRAFISAMATRVGDLGTANDDSRFSISEFAHTNTWYHYNFASAGTNYTTEVSDVLLYQYAARTLSGGTSIYRAMQEAKTAVNGTAVSGRTVPKVIVLMTDAFCFQIEGAALDVAQELKDAGFYIVVMAIGPAVSCTDLNAIASTGGYFSAADYQTLENNVITMVESIFTSACTNAPPFTPFYDLTSNLISFSATGCTPGPGTFSADYTITNNGVADFNANLKIAFYDADPTSANAMHLVTQDVGTQTISAGGNYMGTVTNAALESTSTLYAVVNIDGVLAVNATPLSYILSSSQLNENTEEETGNNFSNSITRVDAGSCAAQAKLNVSVNNTGQTCNDEVIYEVTICNNGNADAIISPTPYADASFVLSNTDILDVLPDSRFIEWQKTLGGTSAEGDFGTNVVQTSDGNYMVSGNSSSGIGGNKTTAGFGNRDIWVIKLDPKGNILWDKTFGGSSSDDRGRLVATNDGGVVVGMHSSSGISGNKTEASFGSTDYWLLKLDANGNIDWQKAYGGSSGESLADLQATPDGGYILSGHSSSGISGNKTTVNYGILDYWIVKVDANGNKLWDQSYGGSASDAEAHIQTTNDGGYLVAGHSQSPISGVKTESSSSSDYWILKLSSTGTIIWQNTLIASGNEVIRLGHTIYETSTGDFIVGGASQSGISGDKTEALNGTQDMWLVTLNGTTGALTNNNGIGGAGGSASFAGAMHEVSTGGFTLLGPNNGGIGGDKTEANQGSYDYWLLKMDESLNIEWQKSFGGSAVDFAGGIDVNSAGDYILVGSSSSGISGDKTEASYGGSDLWVIKYKEGKVLSPNDCYRVQYTYNVSGASAGNYDFSADLIANKTEGTHQDPSISPDNSFTVGTTTGLNGFNGGVQTADDVTIGTVTACPGGDLLSIAVDIPDNTVCEQSYTTATVTITNNSGGSFSSVALDLNLSGTGTMYASEPYSLTNGLVLPFVNTADASYPAVTNALYNGSGMNTLSIYTLPNGTSTFKIDLEIGTGLANLTAQLNNIPTGYNATNQSNLGTDATGITGEANPTISGTCPPAITAATASISLSYTVTGATTTQWVSGTNGTFSVPNVGTTNYTVNAQDVANGFVDLSVIATTASNCQTVENCRVAITGVNYDYGDAPASYDLNNSTVPVAAASTILTDLYLGTTAPDTEGTTSANVDATGDGADEDAMDGVSLTRPTSGAIGYTIPVEVTNNSAETAYLTAFIDWNDDGDFLDTLEKSTQITIAASSGVTTQNPSFDIPNIISNNELFLRLRLSTDNRAGEVPYGAAAQGETEDVIIFCLDSDGDSICDIDDIDDDNDGIRDIDECPNYSVYTFNRTSSAALATNLDVSIVGVSTTISTITNQNGLSNDLTYNGFNWHLLATNIVPDVNGNISVSLIPDAGTGGSFILVDAMLVTNGTNTYVVNDGSASWSSTGSWILQSNANSYLGDNYYAHSPPFTETAIWTFTVASTCDTDGDGLSDNLDLDSDGDGCYDKIEAGVTGYTTDGSVTDSLAATTAAEVGNNGLDDDIESDDTQGATTSGSYTITQTNSGTNDFQDGTQASACPLCGQPGGIPTQLWLKANAGVSGTTAVSTWADQSGNSNNASQGTGTSQPILSAGVINFNPALTFSNDFFNTSFSINQAAKPDVTIFTIYRPHVNNAGAIWGEDNGGWDRFILDNSNAALNSMVSNGSGGNLNINNLYVANQTNLTAVIYDNGATNGSSVSINGTNERTFTANQTGTSSNLQIGALGSSNYTYDGEIAEVIVYNSLLSATGRQKVESYLAIKYGLTLPNNYVAANGTILWDVTANAAYQNDIAGIGREDCIELDQRQSISQNTPGVVEIYNGDVTSSFPSTNTTNANAFSADDSYLLWGNNSGSTVSFNNSIYSGTDFSIGKIWKVAETGTVGTTTIRVLKSDLPSGISHIYINDNNDNTFPTSANTKKIELTDDGTYLFATVDFTDGDLFTFGTPPVDLAYCPSYEWTAGTPPTNGQAVYAWHSTYENGAISGTYQINGTNPSGFPLYSAGPVIQGNLRTNNNNVIIRFDQPVTNFTFYITDVDVMDDQHISAALSGVNVDLIQNSTYNILYNADHVVTDVTNGDFTVLDATPGDANNSPALVGIQITTTLDEIHITSIDGGTGNIVVGFGCGYDWGDAPDTYGTDLNLTNGGASDDGDQLGANSHVSDLAGHGFGQVYINTSPDDELDGIPNANGIGDDGNGDDDETSALANLVENATAYSTNITVYNSLTTTSKLIGWLDWNDDGIFDASEASNVITVAANSADDGTLKTLSWTGLTGITDGNTHFLRLRISNDAALSASTPYGFYDMGEVEDYEITVLLDSDGDEIADVDDIDDDNDGIRDVDECNFKDGSSLSTAFTALGQARNVSSAGVYFFNLNGTPFSSYVDANGYVQVAVDFGNGSGNLPQGTSLTNSTRGILTPTALATLTDATSVRISHSGGNFDVTTTNATILSRITTNTTLHQGVSDNTINNDWTGTEASAMTTNASGGTSSGNSLHQNIVHTSGNGGGTHWIPSGGTQRIRHSSGAFSGEIANAESFTIWVQAASVAIPPCIDTDNDGITDDLDLDSDGDGCYDKIEAGVTGFTTDGTVTDSLAATTAAEVGANGLADDIESDDTQAATTAGGHFGAYTITQTNVGTNDFQDAAVQSLDCPCLTIDSDNDGVCDANDIDDDNDGIRDVDEYCSETSTFNNGSGGSTHSFTVDDAKSMIININEVDKPVDITINGTTLHAGPIAFQDASNNDVIFVSDDAFITNSWQLNTNGLPRARIIIDAAGTVTVFGTRTTTSTVLEAMKIEDGSSFNTISFITGSNSFSFENLNQSGADELRGEATIVSAACDSDGDGLFNHLDLDSDGDGCYDKIEAGVTGFTTDGTVTDSLAATTAAEVGMNGLDDDIESDDTQAATTSGFYTITQTNAGTNDFQDVSINACPIDCITGLDTDNDGVNDLCDLDDDNDGILDTDECSFALTNTWTTSTNSATGSAGNLNITLSHVLAANTNNTYGNETFGSTDLWSTSGLVGATALRMSYTWDTSPENQQAEVDAGTITVTFDFGELVENPIIHIDRLGGGNGNNPSGGTVTYFSNSSEFTLLTPNITMTKLAGNSQFIVDGGKFYRTPDVNLGTGSPNKEASNSTTSTAAGSIQFTGSFSTLTFSVTGIGQESSIFVRETMEFIFESCQADTDKDGIINSLDTDSDNDGCPDATEGANNLATTATLTGGSIGGSSANLGTTSNSNGIPTAAAVNATTGQATTTAVTTAEQIIINPALVDHTADENTNTSFTVNATGIKTTTFNAGTPDYTNPNGTNTTGALTYKWFKTAAPNTILSTTSTLLINNVVTADAGDYTVQIAGTDNSCIVEDVVTLTVIDPCTNGATVGVVTANDKDADGINNICDLDDDNDGILDVDECNFKDGLSSATAFTALGQARNVSSAGVYFFNLSGTPFSSYVDANGYVQVAVDFGNGSGNLPQGTSLTNSTRGILTPAALATLTDATSVRISHSGGNLDVTTTNATILSRITTNTTLHQGVADNTINNDWTGTEASAMTINATGTSSFGNSLHQNIVHTRGNGGGTHWIPSIDEQRIRYNSGAFSGEIANAESFTIWVQAASVALPPCNDTDNDGITDDLDLDSDGDGCYDKIEAGVTGYTTDGSVTDSLAATTAAEVGANGLADDIESEDTQAATTSGSYTITQTNAGTNDFQDASINTACSVDCTTGLDTDNDGVSDLCDLDDDNDGIPDIEECPVNTSSYILDVSATDYSGFGINGGFFDLTYTLNSGSAIPSIGNSFTVRVNYSDFNNSNGFDNQWATGTSSTSYAGIEPNVSFLYSDLPVNNQSQEADNSNVSDVEIRSLLSSGAIDILGDFTITIGAVPSATGYNVVNEQIDISTRYNVSGVPSSGLYDNGYYATYENQTVANTTHPAGTLPVTVSHGQTYTFNYTAFSNGVSTNVNPAGRPLIALATGLIIFSPDCPDTDMDGTADYLDLDSDGDGCYDKIEAGVTGYTTDGSVTDSLAATTAAEVGANGLADDIENEDTQAATTSGSYTITQTNAGTNDFQDASINTACSVDCTTGLDTDNDGVSDLCDLDDDNDGILDSEECPVVLSEYILDRPSTDHSGFGINGGYFDMVYTLNSGTTVPSIGNSFTIRVNYSDFNNESGADNQWLAPTTNSSITPNVTSLFTSLPTNNQTSETNHNTTSTDGNIRELLTSGAIDTLGSFLVTIGAIPSAAGYNVISEQINIATNYNATSPPPFTEYINAYYAVYEGQSTILGGNGAGTVPATISHNQAYKFNYTAFWNGVSTVPSSRSLLSLTNGKIIFAQDCPDTDNDSIADYLDLDSDGDGCYDKIEAGVTGFTTDGSVTDSLAATTAGEVGSNGLADDIESDDTQSATTAGGHSGAYTITQTNAGTNDFQDASINACPIDCTTGLDTDNDGINDLCDLDDDNDGILDIDEGLCVPALTDNSDMALWWPVNNAAGGNNIGVVINSNMISTITPLSAGTGLGLSVIGGVEYQLTNLNQSTFIDAFANNDYIEGAFTTISGTSDLIQGVSLFGPDAPRQNYDITVLLSKDGFSTYDIIVQDRRQIDDGVDINLGTITYGYQANPNLYLEGGTNYTIRWYIYNADASTKNIDNLALHVCESLDTDGDGIFDRLDTDSDNDGCPDATEGANNLATTATLAGGSIGGSSANLGTTSNSNGIPTAAAVNATTGQATTTAVTTAEQITINPALVDHTADENTNTSFTVSATGIKTTTFNAGTPDYTSPNGTNTTGALTYEWFKTTAPSTILSTTSTLLLNNVVTADAGDYTVQIAGTDNSCIVEDVVTLTVANPCTNGASVGVVTANDKDADGINNICDLDDDNDGILDVDECNFKDGLSSATAFTALGQARNVSSAGVYFFNLSGTPFSSYVDANGYVQVAVDFGNGSGNLPQGTSLTNSTRGILTPTALATLTDATSVRISHSGGNFDVTTTNATILSRITTNTTLHQGVSDNTINNDWTGTEASAMTTNASGGTSSGNSLHQNIVHTSGNGGGTHWIPSGGTQRIRHSSGSFSGEIANAESFTIWVQAASVTIPSCVDTDNDGLTDDLDLDSDGDGCYDKIEAGVTGYTTDGSVTDSLAATTAAEVGANGLADDIESEDTQAATTSGSYTITQTNAGTNDFQDASINACPIDCTTGLDTDNDGINDLCDIDDDNDGIPDIEECPVSTSSYVLDVSATDYSGFGINGGFFDLTYTLNSGSAIPSIGNSFTVRVNYSDFNNSNGFDNQWATGTSSTSYAGIEPNVSSLYTNLPVNNQTAETNNGSGTGASARFLLSSGAIDYLGDFTITIASIPSVTGYSLINEQIDIFTSFNLLGEGNPTYLNGYYATYENQLVANTAISAGTIPATVSHGQTYTFNYTGFSDGSSGNVDPAGRPLMALATGIITFVQDCPDTDMDGIADYLDLDSDGDGCYDKIEAGVTGFTTDGSVTDSLAATTAGEVGMNGLDDDIESDDTQAATTSGSYTIIQTNAGTNDFQDASINDACPIDCTTGLDTDNDGVSDLCDLDDDNDGIPDIEECPNNYSVYTFNRTSSADLATNLDVSIVGASTTISTIADQNGLSNDLTYNGFNWHLLATDIVPNENGNISVSFVPDAGTGGNFIMADAMLVTDGTNTYVVNDGSASWSSTGSWILQSNTNSYSGDNYYAQSPPFTETAIWTFTVTSICDTDGDGLPDYLDLDSDADGCFDATEAGHGQAVDANGMIATMSTEVGTNGLDNDVEISDAATTAVNYTLTQTQAGTNDFQTPVFRDASCPYTIPEGCAMEDASAYAGLNFLGTGAYVSGGLGLTQTFSNVGNFNGTNIDIKVTVIAESNSSEVYSLGPDGGGDLDFNFTTSAAIANNTATLRFEFFETGTTTPFPITHAFSIGDIDGGGSNGEVVVSGGDLLGYMLANPTNLTVNLGSGNVTVTSNITADSGDPQTVILQFAGTSTIDVRLRKEFGSSAYGFNGSNFSLNNGDCFCVRDIDNDGICDLDDIDDDNDGIRDVDEGLVDTDNDGMADYLDLDADGDGCYDKIEAGVTGFTTDGSVTDSLAATTAAEVGMNGLDDDVESDDSQAATTAGSHTGNYDITQTNSGTNDFQDASINNACLIDCTTGLDTDNDGVNDLCDLDDDNDGIRDVDECPVVLSEYTMDAAATDYSGFGINGGFFDLTYTLNSGPAIPSIGSSFTIRVNYTDLNNVNGVDNQWQGGSSITSFAGIVPNDNSLLTSLPTNNQTMEVSINSTSLDERIRTLITSGAIDNLGDFSITIGAVPSASGYSLVSESISMRAAFAVVYNVADNTINSGAYYAVYENQPNFQAGNFSNTASSSLSHDQTYQFNYTAFSNGSTTLDPQERGLVELRNGSITFAQDCPDTDMDGIADYLDLDSDGDGCYDKIEAGVTGFTTDGSVTDSLAATTAAEVGMNGLDDDVESDDSQAATTAGSHTGNYDITQTNSGTNDFQDAAITIACINDAIFIEFTDSIAMDLESVGGNLPTLTVSGGVLTSASTIELVLNSSPGTATAGTDYQPNFGNTVTVNIPAGDYTTPQIIVLTDILSITDDTNAEPDEPFSIDLINPQDPTNQLTIGDADGMGYTENNHIYTIIDDDCTPSTGIISNIRNGN